MKLKALDVLRLTTGKYADGGQLFLNVTSTGKRSWTYRYISPITKKTREMGLGTPPQVSLAEARELRNDAYKLVRAGTDPIEKRDADREAKVAAQIKSEGLMTFKQAADGWFTKKRGEWDSPRYGAVVDAALRRYVFPKIGTRTVVSLTVHDIKAVMMQPDPKGKGPIWETRHPTATRILGTVEDIIDWAIANDARTDLNPARWEIMDKVLQKPSTVHVVKHHPSVPYAEMPVFMAALLKRPSLSARLLEFTILTATRSSEARKAKWDEIEWKDRQWTVPAARMKGKKNKRKPHTVPLSTRAVVLLRELQGKYEGDFIFPGWATNKDRVAPQPLSDAACAKVLEMMGRTETLHGFRSSFRTWASEETDYAREICEKAVAHTVGDDTERAYDRGDLLKKRRGLMQAWCDFCLPVRLENVA